MKAHDFVATVEHRVICADCGREFAMFRLPTPERREYRQHARREAQDRTAEVDRIDTIPFRAITEAEFVLLGLIHRYLVELRTNAHQMGECAAPVKGGGDA